jgi:hypothetical protein
MGFLDSLFRSRHEPDPVPPQPLTMDRRHFEGMFRSTQTVVREYSREVGIVPSAQALVDMFDVNVGGIAPGGNWVFGANQVNPHSPTLRFADQPAVLGFLNALGSVVNFDIAKITSRKAHATSLKGKAANGLLYADLMANLEPEGNYYTAPAPRAATANAPPVPVRPHSVDYYKAKAWLLLGVQGTTRAYTTLLRQLEKTDGSFPLGPDDTILRGAWQQLVQNPPAYRGWNSTASQQKYPSNIGGNAVLNWFLGDMVNGTQMPAQGSLRWYDYALCTYGSIMAAQPFTDGNKRASRLAYVLMLLSGQVPFLAPNGRLGGRLADML